jgi:hypothetical protein
MYKWHPLCSHGFATIKKQGRLTSAFRRLGFIAP